MTETVAILLAAGESRRMGEPKALLPWQGTSLLAHQVASMRSAGVDRVVVVLGHRADELKGELEGINGVSWALNPDYRQGKTTSVKVGVSAAEVEQAGTLLILNVDQPRSADTIRALIELHRAAGQPAQDHYDLPALDQPRGLCGPVEASLRSHRPEHRRFDA